MTDPAQGKARSCSELELSGNVSSCKQLFLRQVHQGVLQRSQGIAEGSKQTAGKIVKKLGEGRRMKFRYIEDSPIWAACYGSWTINVRL